ncbi:MAG: hypothetical protein J6A33_00500 [Alphaproteobacteria bacterium]|nr:hypothetical protein [Alphaproteobacteria bacterium]
MPQLDTSTFASQLFWLCICFFTMLFIMSKIIIPKIADILEQRQRKIDSYLNKAYQIKLQAEEALKKYQDALTDAAQKANASLAETQNELNQLVEKKQQDLDLRLHKKIMEGEAEIEQSREDALNKVKSISEELALEIIKKIGIDGINKTDIKNAIKDAEGQ